jgi:hypothetical protein
VGALRGWEWAFHAVLPGVGGLFWGLVSPSVGFPVFSILLQQKVRLFRILLSYKLLFILQY